MTEELKTLEDYKVSWNDLKWSRRRINKEKSEADFVRFGAIRQEAIRWIKDLESGIVEDDYGKLPMSTKQCQELAIADWIKHFFNISEEDIEAFEE